MLRKPLLTLPLSWAMIIFMRLDFPSVQGSPDRAKSPHGGSRSRSPLAWQCANLCMALAMGMRITCALFAALPLAACSYGAIQGSVRDATTGQPIPGAAVALTYSSPDLIGLFGGGTRIETTTTDASGRFKIARDGGSGLDIRTPDGRRANGRVCPRSPTTVYVGGPYARVRMNHLLVLSASGTPAPDDLNNSPRLHASALGLVIQASRDGQAETLSITAEGGVAFVPGTGAIPIAPTRPYPTHLSFNPRTDCGWIFVERAGRIAAVIAAADPHELSTPSGYRERTLLFSELPK